MAEHQIRIVNRIDPFPVIDHKAFGDAIQRIIKNIQPVEKKKMHTPNIELLMQMAHSPLMNYAVPGLTSSLIGAPSKEGAVRMFQSDRDQIEVITPHSHRFDFTCIVLSGRVRNLIWKQVSEGNGDEYQQSHLVYRDKPGSYKKTPGSVDFWSYGERTYTAGDSYSMKADQVHSIYFSRGAQVLFFEGPAVSDTSIVLEPHVNGETIQTLEVKPWMFKKPAAKRKG